MWDRVVAAAGWCGGGHDSVLNRGARWVSGGEVCVLCVPTRLVQLGADVRVHLRFPVGESTHKQMQNYAQIDPECIDGIGTSVTTQLT